MEIQDGFCNQKKFYGSIWGYFFLFLHHSDRIRDLNLTNAPCRSIFAFTVTEKEINLSFRGKHHD